MVFFLQKKTYIWYILLAKGYLINNHKYYLPMKKTFKAALILVAALLNCNYLFAQENADHFWKPVEDAPFLQERREVIPTDTPISQVAILNESVYIVKDGKLVLLQGDKLISVKAAPDQINKIEVLKVSKI